MRAMIPPDLPALAETIATWADEAPGVPHVYVFGSRVRGDHHPGSDVDLFLFQEEWDATSENVDWWQAQSMAEYRDLGDALPGPLHILLETYDASRDAVLAARADPACIVLQVRKVTCLWTPPRLARPTR
jgi:hypothetical protein